MTTEEDKPMVSVLTKHQTRKYEAEWYDGAARYKVEAEVRYDDCCGNGHNTFSITGSVYGPSGLESCGCVHEDIAAHIPELAPLLKWHLMSSGSPLHYVANTVYLAGDRDYHGLRAGEFRQHTSRGAYQNGGRPGVKNWVIDMPSDIPDGVYCDDCPAPLTLQWRPYGRTGEGKARDLDGARSVAIWPEATDEELMQEPEDLEKALLARLPGLQREFKRMVEELGFVY